MFGFSAVSQDQAGGIIRLGKTKVLVSLTVEALPALWTTSRSGFRSIANEVSFPRCGTVGVALPGEPERQSAVQHRNPQRPI
jgi:hypothetical protein